MRPIKLNPQELDLIIESLDNAIYECFQAINSKSSHLNYEHTSSELSEKIIDLSDLSEKIFNHLDILIEDEYKIRDLPKNVLPFSKEMK